MTEETTTESRARDLFGRTAAGDGAALGLVYDLLAPRLLGYARSLVANEADAEEALQETFLGLARNRRNLASVESPLAYLFRSVRHAALAVRDARARGGRALESVPEPLVEGAAPDVLAAEVDETNARLALLPPEQREVVVLKVFGELTFKEIGALLRIPLNTAASRFRYGLDRLRERRG